MPTNEVRRELLDRAKASGYPGSIVDVFQAADQGIDLIEQHQMQQQEQEMMVAQTPQEQEVGLREQHAMGNTQASMAFPDVQPNQSFNTVGMQAPIDIQKIDNQGHLVESYKNVPPGIQDLPTGPSEGTIIESPAAYQKGGVRNVMLNTVSSLADPARFFADQIRKRVIPLNVKQYLASLTGIGKQNIDASDLSRKEKKALEEARKNAEKRGSKTIEYEDYQTHIDKKTGKPYQNQYEDVGGGDPNAPITKFFDPSYSVKTTFGQLDYSKKDDGTYVYTDKYNFNERKNKPSKTFIESAKEKGLDPYAQARNIATYFGPGPGEGGDVNIKLQTGGFQPFDFQSILTEEQRMPYDELLRRQRFQESSFDPKSVSPKGAKGVAQFTPITLQEMKRLGFADKNTTMKDLEDSNLSRKLQKKYMDHISKKSWIKGNDQVKRAKTLIAYNYGPDRTRRKLNKLKARGVDINDINFIKHFNKESRDYVGRILLSEGDFEKQYTDGLLNNLLIVKRKGGLKNTIKELQEKAESIKEVYDNVTSPRIINTKNLRLDAKIDPMKQSLAFNTKLTPTKRTTVTGGVTYIPGSTPKYTAGLTYRLKHGGLKKCRYGC